MPCACAAMCRSSATDHTATPSSRSARATSSHSCCRGTRRTWRRPGRRMPPARSSATLAWWRDWCARLQYEGRWKDDVRRSLIVLKAMTFSPTGGIVAAPTTSLPESIGGVRNWDYRYCWLRDATFSLWALHVGGYIEEARAWHDWLLRAAAGDPGQPADTLRAGRREPAARARATLAGRATRVRDRCASAMPRPSSSSSMSTARSSTRCTSPASSA